MKKIMVKISVFTACLGFAASAFAAQSITSAGTTIGGGTFKTSTNVSISLTATATAYAATSQHTSGSKQYGTLSSDPKIMSKAAATNGPTATTSATALPDSGWQ